MKRVLVLAALAASFGAGAAPFTLTEGFDAPPVGWVVTNNSTPGGTTSWFQGNPGIFAAHAGAANSYAAANFNSAPVGGQISTWLISPELSFASQLLSFFTRTESTAGGAFGDGLRVWVSDSGASTSLADFDQLLLTINPGNQLGGFPNAWTEFTANLLAAGSGRIAFEYFNGNADLANYIGVDTINVTRRPIGEPGALLLAVLAAGVAGIARRRLAVGAALLAAVALPAGAQAPVPSGSSQLASFPHVRIVHSPQRAQASAPDASQGLMAFIDPESGELVQPSAEGMAELTAARQAAERLPAGAAMMQARRIRAVGGGWGISTDASHMSYFVVRRNADGRLAGSCTVGEDTAERMLALGGPVILSRKEEEQ